MHTNTYKVTETEVQVPCVVLIVEIPYTNLVKFVLICMQLFCWNISGD